MRAVLVLALVACGDNAAEPVPEVRGGCLEVPWASDEQFSRSADFERAVADTLEDWNPSGRWFFTDAFLGRSSIGLRRDEAKVVSDTGWTFEVSDTELFMTELRVPPEMPMPGAEKFRYTQRISNLILDLANPAAPALLGYFNTWDPKSFESPSGFYSGAIGIDVDLTRRLLFVADTARGLLILRDET